MFSLQTLAALTLGTTMMFEAWGYMLPQQNPTDLLILVNKTNKAPAVPVTLVKPNVQPTRESASENIYMRPEAAAALEALFAGAAEDGLTLYATSGYRSYSTQKAIFERKLDRMSEKQANLSVAKPGYSEHQTGLAMDIEGETTKGTGLTEAFGESQRESGRRSIARNTALSSAIQRIRRRSRATFTSRGIFGMWAGRLRRKSRRLT